ncbi:MAG: hypothetical protein ABI333_00105 [bacterium]
MTSRVLPPLIALAALLTAQTQVDGRRLQRRGATGIHVVYAWQERVDQIPIQHEVHLYGNGYMRYAQRAGAGAVQETTLPSDKPFVLDLVEQFRAARAAKQLVPPCGAPQGGTLTVRLGRRPLRLDLTRTQLWNRFGGLVRKIIARVVGAVPQPLEADCQPLRLRVDPSRLTQPRRLEKLGTRAEEQQLLLRYGAAQSGEERLEVLASLALIRDGDRFFRWELLRRHPGSVAARRLVRRHASELVRGVRDEAEARELLGTLGQLSGPEGRHHRAVLQLFTGQTAEASRNLHAFHTSLNQLGTARRVVGQVGEFQTAQVDARRIRPPWGRIRRAFPRQFLFWLRLAQPVWVGDPDQAPPLALALYRRALRFGVLSALNPSVRAGSGGAQTVRAARALVRSHYARLSRGRWDRLPYAYRQDLLSVSGYVRRFPTSFPKEWIEKNLDDRPRTVCRMVRMAYLVVADRFIERMVELQKAKEGPLRLAQGRCLAERERWAGARKAFSRAAELGVSEARIALAEMSLDQGDLGGAERVLEALGNKSAEALRIESRLWRLRDRPTKAIRAAEAAQQAAPDARSRYAVGRSWELVGRRDKARAAYSNGLREPSTAGLRARLALAKLELAAGQPRAALDAAWPLTRAAERRFRASGHAAVAMAAAGMNMEQLVELQVARAAYHAWDDPAALAEVADILIAQGRGLGVALNALLRARGKRPRWSRLFALSAFLYGQLRQLPRAMQSITAALDVRPEYPPYRAIEQALVRLGGSG